MTGSERLRSTSKPGSMAGPHVALWSKGQHDPSQSVLVAHEMYEVRLQGPKALSLPGKEAANHQEWPHPVGVDMAMGPMSNLRTRYIPRCGVSRPR